MNNIKLYAAFAFAAALMVSCKDSNDDGGNSNDGSVVVEIATEVETRASVTTSYAEGDKLNVYVKSYNSIESASKLDGVRAEYKNGSWDVNPQIRLKDGEVAFIYAVSPYNADYTNGAAIPVDVTKQVDLLYSGGSVGVTYRSPKAALNMKHAMALASFNIIGSGNKTLNSLTITGEKVYTKATFNLETGKFTGKSTDAYTQSCNNVISTEGWTENYPQIWSVPFSTKTSTAQLTAVIDGQTYVCDFPEVEMRNGYQYIFRLVLTSYGLEFIPSMTETISLNVNTDQFGDLENYGMLRFEIDGLAWNLPQLIGNGVFGKVGLSNGEALSYQADKVTNVKFDGATGNNVSIESWNSTGFQMEDLVGVTTIDISDY